VDARPSKGLVRKGVWVRIPPAASRVMCRDIPDTCVGTSETHEGGASWTAGARAPGSQSSSGGVWRRIAVEARARVRFVALDLDVPALREAAHRKRDEQHLHGKDQQRKNHDEYSVKRGFFKARLVAIE